MHFDILVEGEKGRERESLSFFLTIPVCHHSGRQRQKEAADRSVTFRNQLIAQQRNDFRPRQLRCSFAARLSASRSGEVHSDKELIQDTTASKRRTVQDEGHTTPVTSSRSSTSPVNMHVHLCLGLVSCDVLLLARRGLTGKRRVVCKPNFGLQLWKRNGYICVYFYWPPGPNPVVTMSTRLGLVRGYSCT